MKILRMTFNDPAGTSILFNNAVNKYTNHTSRLITTGEKYEFCFKKDIHVPDIKNNDFDEIHQILKDSDIFHFEILSDEEMTIGPFKVKDYIKGKKITHTHHGHPSIRSTPEKYRRKYKKLKRKILVSTPDLLIGLPEAIWQPNCIPLDDPLYLPSDERYPEFTIGHSPTRTDIKDTVIFLDAAHKAGVSVDIIMHTKYEDCLKRKKKANAIFDHLQSYYGMSSLESLSMDKYVFANLSQFVQNHIYEFTGAGWLPWFNVGAKEELPLLFRKVKDWGIGCPIKNNGYRDWMKRFWSEEMIVNRLIKFYETL